MRTKQIADRAAVNIETLRYYERRGLLSEPPRTSGGYREYPTSTVRVLRFIKRSQALGFTLAEVEGLVRLAEGGPDSCEAARELATTHAADLGAKIAELQRMRAALIQLANNCSQPRSNRSCPLLEAISNPDQPLGSGAGR